MDRLFFIKYLNRYFINKGISKMDIVKIRSHAMVQTTSFTDSVFAPSKYRKAGLPNTREPTIATESTRSIRTLIGAKTPSVFSKVFGIFIIINATADTYAATPKASISPHKTIFDFCIIIFILPRELKDVL